MKLNAFMGAFATVAVAAALVSGCIMIDVDEADYSAHLPRGGVNTCQASDYTPLVGLNEDDIDRDHLPQTFRIVCHDCQVTMDFNPNRLNIQLDENNRVSSVSCG